MSAPHAIRPLQLTALASLTLMLAALACVHVHQVSGDAWALWMALTALATSCTGTGYLIGTAAPACAHATAAQGSPR